MQSQIKYIIRRHEDFKVAKTALNAGDLSTLQTLGHKWKGNGATFGYPELGQLGEQLEIAAANQQLEEVNHLVSQFQTWLVSHPIQSANS